MTVVKVRCENSPQVPFVEDDDMAEALSTVPPYSAGWRCYPGNFENIDCGARHGTPSKRDRQESPQGRRGAPQ